MNQEFSIQAVCDTIREELDQQRIITIEDGFIQIIKSDCKPSPFDFLSDCNVRYGENYDLQHLLIEKNQIHF